MVAPTGEPLPLYCCSVWLLALRLTSRTRHADLREGFLTDYPRAYRNRASVRTHREAAEAARNSAATAEGYMEEHTRYG